MQLITSSIVGGVAVDVFLLFQLPRMLRPRLHFCYLKHKDGSDMREAYLEVYRPELELTGGYWQWVHLRITNVGTIYYSRFTLACELPNEDWGGTYVISRDDDYYNLYKANGEQIKQFNPDLGRGPEYLASVYPQAAKEPNRFRATRRPPRYGTRGCLCLLLLREATGGARTHVVQASVKSGGGPGQRADNKIPEDGRTTQTDAGYKLGMFRYGFRGGRFGGCALLRGAEDGH